MVNGSIIQGMVIGLNEKKRVTLDQLGEFIAASSEGEFRGCGQDVERFRDYPETT